MDRNQFRKQFALRLAFGSPVTVVPFLGGLTAIGAGWAGMLPATAIFAGIAGLVIGGGILATRARFFGQEIARKLHEEFQAKDHDATEAALDALRKKLAEDKDTRDERMLDQLRELGRVFKRDTAWAGRINTVSAAEIAGGVEELIRKSIQDLDDAFKIRRTADDLSSSPYRDVLIAQREQILREVEANIRELTELLTGVYALGTKGNASAETTQVRDRLKQSLEVARRVDQQLHPEDPKAVVQAAIRQRQRVKRTPTT